MPFVTAVAFLAVCTSVTCALPGTILVLRRQSMLIHGISHAVLPGIVLGAFISGKSVSPIMTFTAAFTGIIVVIGAEQLRKTGLVTGDANQGLIFPTLFSIGVILLSTVLSDVGFHSDMVLSGDINLRSIEPEHVIIGGLIDIGPRTAWNLLFVCAINAVFMAVTFRVLKVSTFDPQSAKVMGFPVVTVDYLFMFLVSITIVVSFDAAGAILVVALMIVPPATGVLISKTLPQLISSTMVIAVISALIGFYVALIFDLPTASTMAVVDGVIFLIVLSIKMLVGKRKGKVLMKELLSFQTSEPTHSHF